MDAARKQCSVWISLIEVEGLEGNSDFRCGEKAFVNGLVLAVSQSSAESQWDRALHERRFHVVAYEDTEKWEIRRSRFDPDPAIIELAKAARESGDAQFGTFHTWGDQG